MSAYIQKFSNYMYDLYKRYENLGYRVKKKVRFIIGRIFLYYVLIEMAFLFILPFVYILSTSMLTFEDYLDPTVFYVPTEIEWGNFSKAWEALDYPRSFLNTVITSFGAAILQTLACSLAGFALGRYKFRLRNIFFVLVVIVLLIPPQTTIIATYGLFVELGLINTYFSVLLPAAFGLGIRGALFILIYMYFFQRIPDAMDDAARIDGAGPLRLFVEVMLPQVKSAIVIVFIFSVVWHWNDNYEAPTFMYRENVLTLQPRLQNIREYWAKKIPAGESEISKALTEPMLFAGCFLVMFPVLLVYIFGQKKLVAGIERIGIIE